MKETFMEIIAGAAIGVVVMILLLQIKKLCKNYMRKKELTKIEYSNSGRS